MGTTMQQMQVKLGVLILVVAAVAGTGNAGLCDYDVKVFTPIADSAGTDGTVTFGVYGCGWTQDEARYGWTQDETSVGDKFDQGNTDTFTAKDKPCFDPCRLTLKMNASGTEASGWFPESVNITVLQKYSYLFGFIKYQKLTYKRDFEVNQWVEDGKATVDVRKDNKCV